MEKKPLFLPSEWHLRELDVKYAWRKDITGSDVTVCVVDDGVFKHPDLIIKDTKVNPIIKNLELLLRKKAYLHGTSVAGIIGAKGNKFVIGIAPDCNLTSYIFIGDLSVNEKYPLHDFILKNNNKIDIFNNSWAPAITTSPNTFDLDIIESIEISIKKGRDGKGNIFVFSSGNENLEGGLVTYIELINNRFTISVGAINRNLDMSTYSNFGLAILCVAPAGRDETLLGINVNTPIIASYDQFGITTTLPFTKKLKEKGFIPYTHDFNGTSAACPMVSGCVALLLSYRPDLTWRDVKELISRSCYQDYYVNNTVPNDEFILNGRKQIVSQRTGYGIINVKKLLKNAKRWHLLPKEKKITQEQNIDVTLSSENPNFTISFDIEKKIIIETVQIYLTVNSNPSQTPPELILNLKVTLISPMGTRLILINNQAVFENVEDFITPAELQYYDDEPFLCELLRGEISKGIWTVEFMWNPVQQLPDTINVLKNARIEIFGYKDKKKIRQIIDKNF